MAKKKKTKEQKIIADLRRQLLKDNLSSQKVQETKQDTPQANSAKEITFKKDFVSDVAPKKNNIVNYSYLMHDLRKTAVLTSSIVALQIVLFFLLTHKILILPGLSY
jgi:hypothetical protein